METRVRGHLKGHGENKPRERKGKRREAGGGIGRTVTDDNYVEC